MVSFPREQAAGLVPDLFPRRPAFVSEVLNTMPALQLELGAAAFGVDGPADVRYVDRIGLLTRHRHSGNETFTVPTGDAKRTTTIKHRANPKLDAAQFKFAVPAS